MKKLITYTCPNCEAKLKIDESRSTFFCEYCGMQIIVEDGITRTEITKNINITKKYIKRDEGRIREADAKVREADAKVEKEKRKKAESKNETITTKVLAVVVIAFLVFAIIAMPAADKSNFFDFYGISSVFEKSDNMITMPASSESYRYKPSEEVIKELEDAGFTNITVVKDKHEGALANLFATKGEVVDVKYKTVAVKAGKKYPADGEIIVICYE